MDSETFCRSSARWDFCAASLTAETTWDELPMTAVGRFPKSWPSNHRHPSHSTMLFWGSPTLRNLQKTAICCFMAMRLLYGSELWSFWDKTKHHLVKSLGPIPITTTDISHVPKHLGLSEKSSRWWCPSTYKSIIIPLTIDISAMNHSYWTCLHQLS